MVWPILAMGAAKVAGGVGAGAMGAGAGGAAAGGGGAAGGIIGGAAGAGGGGGMMSGIGDKMGGMMGNGKKKKQAPAPVFNIDTSGFAPSMGGLGQSLGGRF